jgi:hypothetical protein
LYFFEKAALLAENKIEKIKLMSELITLLYAKNDEKKLKLTIKDFNKIDIVLEAVFLEQCSYPYQQSQSDVIIVKKILLEDEKYISKNEVIFMNEKNKILFEGLLSLFRIPAEEIKTLEMNK